MKSLICLMVLLSVMTKLNAQVEHLEGQTKLINPQGRTLMLERDNEDSWLTFHDPNDFWYSLGIDRSNSGKFCINVGGSLNSSQFVMDGYGNVGIGTTSPDKQLTLKTDGYIGWKYQSGYDCFHTITAGGLNPMSFTVNPFSANTPIFKFNGNKGTVLTMLNDGNVGIGTTDPMGFKLAVKGKIGAEEVQVKANYWSDFVFENDYKLKDLEEVETFIEENKHLPDVPSEKEVLENGIQLGEMDAKLLQKIEELTLYMIEMNKRVKLLEKENMVLKDENKILKTL